MKLPRFVWVIAKTLGLGAAAIYVAGANVKDVKACEACYFPTHACSKDMQGGEACYWTFDSGSWVCHLINNCYSGS